MSNICRICNKQFKFPYLLFRHQNKKNRCKSSSIIQLDLEKKIKELESQIDKQREEWIGLLDKQNEKIEKIEIVTEQSTKNEEYRCEFCDKKFSFQANLYRHLKQKSCKGKNDNVSIYERELGIEKQDIDQLTCRFCMVKFSKQQSYSRHMKNVCKMKQEYEIELENRVKQNRKELAASVSFNGNQNKYCSDNTTIVNNNIYIPQMNAFGNENLDYITTNMLIKQIQMCEDFSDITDTVKTFTQLIHAHPAHPENHNVSIKGNNSALAEVFNGKKMEQVNSLGVQDQILNNVGKLLIAKKTEYNDECQNVPKQLDNKLIKLEESIIDNIDDELRKRQENFENEDPDQKYVIENSRKLTSYRNTIKGVFLSNKEEIRQTQAIACS